MPRAYAGNMTILAGGTFSYVSSSDQTMSGAISGMPGA